MTHLVHLCLVPLLCCCMYLEAVETNINPDSAYLATIRSRQETQWTGNLAVILGVNDILGDEWTGAERPINTGLMFDIGKKGWFANIAIDYKTSSESGTFRTSNVEGSMSELDIGFRMHIDDELVHWKAYLGAGIALIENELDIDGAVRSGSETGYWINTGLYYRYQQRWNIGMDLRYSSVIQGFEDNDNLSPAHFTYGMFAGYHF